MTKAEDMEEYCEGCRRRDYCKKYGNHKFNCKKPFDKGFNNEEVTLGDFK